MKSDIIRQKSLSLFEEYATTIGESPLTRVLSATYLFDFLDRLRAAHFPDNWFDWLEGELRRLSSVFEQMPKYYEISAIGFPGGKDNGGEAIEVKTGEVYFNLWKHFKSDEYYLQALTLLAERLEKNNISLKGVKTALDDGCGAGRYTMALKKLGCEHIEGIDISGNSIELAEKMNPFNLKDVSFQQGSVLDLPFDDGHFDFVFSNGVLHHTSSTKQGLREIFRVLRRGGRCWLYLYGGKESFFWDLVDFCRKLLSAVPQSYTQRVMEVMGYPPGRIFHRTDFFYVPINRRYFQEELEKLLIEIGFGQFTRLKRGAVHDWDEIIYNNPSIDPYIYGEGEMRYLICKD